MPLLYYWRGDNYRRDLDFGTGYHLNQNNALMHRVGLGDSLWAFTRARNGTYALAAELVIKAKTQNPPGFRYGRYRVWGDLRESRYFRVEGAPSIDQVIRHLSVAPRSSALGTSFQGLAAVREITQDDQRILRAAARELDLEPRARLLPEERLEANLLLGDGEAVRELVHREQPGIAEERRAYLYGEAAARDQVLLRELQERYQGRCQICLWDPVLRFDRYLCHHLQWLSRGGQSEEDNLLLVCPNDHAAIHPSTA